MLKCQTDGSKQYLKCQPKGINEVNSKLDQKKINEKFNNEIENLENKQIRIEFRK